MALKHSFFAKSYKFIFKPIAFTLDAEFVHDRITTLGEYLENFEKLVSYLFAYKDKNLEKNVLGIKFANPIGLAAGFDYDGHMAQVLKSVGFGFNTVGTVTALPYEGNDKPRLGRLPKSQSLLVNKGFKSEGAIAIAKRLDKKKLKNHIIGISVGSTNSPKIDTLKKSIDDYLFTFGIFKNKNYVKYFELNISCPNIALKDVFLDTKNLAKLLHEISKIKLKQPIFVKMPNEINTESSDEIIKTCLKYKINAFIFGNLVKSRKNKWLKKEELKKVAHLKGNFSGRPTTEGVLKLIKHSREKFGDKIVIVGCGGTFNSKDAKDKLKAGADLVQLITGIIFEGPQLVGQICEELAKDTN